MGIDIDRKKNNMEFVELEGKINKLTMKILKYINMGKSIPGKLLTERDKLIEQKRDVAKNSKNLFIKRSYIVAL